MKGDQNPADYLRDILEVAEKISRFIEGLTHETFCADEKTVFAVVRGLEIVGEAVRNIPPTFRTEHPDVPWQLMAGMRDRLIHDYGGVNLVIVWNAASKELPKIEPRLREILDEIGG